MSKRKDNEAERCRRALVSFFNTAEGFAAFGSHGDYEEWPPEKTAIEAMRECIKLRRLLMEIRVFVATARP